MLTPSTVDEAAALLKEHASTGRPIHPVGDGSRGTTNPAGSTALSTKGLNRILEHNPGDFTAVLEAGVPLAQAQAAFGSAGQWLALDPPDGLRRPHDGASGAGLAEGGTVGGLVATADSGPARHRYGGVRDLIIGITVVLSDGTVARAGGKVIKNVAGYDLAKLFTGSYGTLGLVAEVAVRLHPRPLRTATLAGFSDVPERIADAAHALARRPLEATCLDVSWVDGRGAVLVRFGGHTAEERAHAAESLLDGLDEVGVISDDDAVWTAQRTHQRSPDGVVLKVSGRPTDIPAVLGVARDTGATAVGRAALGLFWLAGPASADWVTGVRTSLAPRACAVVDGGGRLPADVPVWPDPDPGALEVMRRVKARFDPARVFRPGTFVGGI
jgi:glycolate oxidase FAD binding subunit